MMDAHKDMMDVSDKEGMTCQSLSNKPAFQSSYYTALDILHSNAFNMTDEQIQSGIQGITQEELNNTFFALIVVTAETQAVTPEVTSTVTSTMTPKKPSRVRPPGYATAAVRRCREKKRLQAKVEEELIQGLERQLQDMESQIRIYEPSFKLSAFQSSLVKVKMSVEQKAYVKQFKDMKERKRNRDKIYARLRYKYSKEATAERKERLAWLMQLMEKTKKCLEEIEAQSWTYWSDW